jgi:hypothetical protein
MRSTLRCLVMVSALSLAGQQSPFASAVPAPVFHIGDEFEAARGLGTPVACYAPLAGRKFPAEECRSVMKVYDRVAPVFDRRTQLNEYEIRLWLRADTTASRLHPTLRIEEAEFLFDKPMLPAAALADIPEAGAICSQGCVLLSTCSPTSLNAISGGTTAALMAARFGHYREGRRLLGIEFGVDGRCEEYDLGPLARRSTYREALFTGAVVSLKLRMFTEGTMQSPHDLGSITTPVVP